MNGGALAKVDKRKYSDRRQYLIKAVHKRRKKIRQMAVEYKGGRCENCGYDRCIEALEFHHRESSHKDFSISQKGYTRSWKKVRTELDKCKLLCANCHREVHVQNAASSGNARVTSRLSQGSPLKKDNPELASDENRRASAETIHLLP
jgi:hypothetical protein